LKFFRTLFSPDGVIVTRSFGWGISKMNMHVEPALAGMEAACLFTAGQFVRIQGGAIVGRVLTDTEGDATRVHIFGTPGSAWGETDSEANFGPGCLAMWTQDFVMPVAAPPCLPMPLLDIDRTNERLMKIVAMSDLLGDLGRLEMASTVRDADDLLPSHLEFIHSVLDDTVGDLLDMISDEEHRRKQEAA
jgi:hypothetical protein